jgi:hypothetical protein
VFDEFERRRAFLVAYRVAEQAAEQADVVSHRTVRLVLEIHNVLHGWVDAQFGV